MIVAVINLNLNNQTGASKHGDQCKPSKNDTKRQVLRIVTLHYYLNIRKHDHNNIANTTCNKYAKRTKSRLHSWTITRETNYTYFMRRYWTINLI